MIACYSFWSGGHRRGINSDFITMQKVSLSLAKKHFKETWMLCDSESLPRLSPLGFDRIEVIFDDIPKWYSPVWAISKLIAFQHICKAGRPFVHIDYDLFLWNKLPERILRAEVFAAHIDSFNVFYDYALAEFLKKCPRVHLLEDMDALPKTALNAGIIGGNNLDFISRYVQHALDIALDKKNEEFMFHTNLMPTDRWCPQHSIKSCILEQYLLVAAARHHGIETRCLLAQKTGNWPDENECRAMGFTHLMAARGRSDVMSKVRKIAQSFA